MMKNSIKVLGLIVAMTLMISCEDNHSVPQPDFSNYSTWLVGEWLLVDAVGITEATDSTLNVYDDKGVLVSYVTKSVYAFSDGVTGTRELTTYTVATETTDSEMLSFEYYKDDTNGLVMSWDNGDDPIDTKIHFRNQDELFTDFLHWDDRSVQPHLKRVR